MRRSERSRSRVIRLLFCTLMICAALPSVLWAGQTRTEQLGNERAQRGREGPPPPQTLIGRALLFLDKTRLLEPSRSARSMFYPKFGTIATGAGIGVGGGYWRSFANDNVFVNTSAVLTMRGYRLGRADVSLPRLLKHTLELKGYARYRYFSQEDFYGLAPDSEKTDRTNYLIEEKEYAGQAIWRPRSWLTLASQTARLAPRVGRGTDVHQPSTETRFTDATAPGLTEQTVFLEHGGLVQVDTRDWPGRPRRGGRYLFYASRYDDRRDRGFEFSRVAVHLEQYVPIFDSKRVVAARLTTNHLVPAEGSRVPFYYMSPIGGKDTIRGFNDLRFRDAHSWLLSTEYRWETIAGLDLALFYDRGSVAPRFRDLSIRKASDAYGLAIRAGTDSSIFLRAAMAFGSGEGARYYVAFSSPLRIEWPLR